jgi:hypothetical protein
MHCLFIAYALPISRDLVIVRCLLADFACASPFFTATHCPYLLSTHGRVFVARCLFIACYPLPIHRPFTVYSPHIHLARTGHTGIVSVHATKILTGPLCLLSIIAVFCCCVLLLCCVGVLLCSECLFTVCSLSVHGPFTAHSLSTSTRATSTVCSLPVHVLLTVNTQQHMATHDNTQQSHTATIYFSVA